MTNPIYYRRAYTEVCVWNTCSALLFVLLFFVVFDYIQSDLNKQEDSKHINLALLKISLVSLLYCAFALVTVRRIRTLRGRIDKRHDERPRSKRKRRRAAARRISQIFL